MVKKCQIQNFNYIVHLYFCPLNNDKMATTCNDETILSMHEIGFTTEFA